MSADTALKWCALPGWPVWLYQPSMPAGGDRLPGERATRALLRRRTAAWVSLVHRHTSKGHCTLGCAVPAARVAGPLPDVLPSATVTAIQNPAKQYHAQLAGYTAYSRSCGLWQADPHRFAEIASGLVCCCTLGTKSSVLLQSHAVLCSAGVPRKCLQVHAAHQGGESCQASGSCRCLMTSACPAAQQYSWDLPVMQELCMVVLLGLAEADLLCASLVAAGSSLCSLLLLPASLPCLPSWAQERRPAGSAKLLTQTGLQTDSMSPVCTFAASLVGSTDCM